MKRLRESNWLLFGLVLGLVLLFVAGVALLGAYIYLSRQSNADSGWVNPVEAVSVKAVAPDLAVLSLAGEPDERIIRAALEAGEKETAYAALAYSVLLPDSLRSGHWLLLNRYCQEQETARADVCDQAALDLATLGPTLSDAARADISLQAARGYMAQAKPWAARLALAQAENIARYSLTLLPAQRRAVLGQLVDVYRNLGDAKTAESIQGGLEAISAGPGITVEQGPQILPSLRGSVVLPDEVATAIVARQQAAANMAARWFSAQPGERDALAQALGKTLLDEDRARSDFYAQTSDLSPPDHLALLHDQVAWLTTKYRAARGAYGVPLVSEWEQQVEEIRAALAKAYTELINGYAQQVDTLSPAEAAQARVELLREGVLWTRLGLFPDHAETALSQQLADASRQLWTRQGSAGLTIIMQDVRGRLFYLLSGSDVPGPTAVGLK